jgi:opacity protein-like surface antigen
MFRKVLIATAAVGLLAAATAAPAAAKIHVNVNLGAPGYYPEPYPVYNAYPVYPAYDTGYDGYDDTEDCGYEVVRVKRWNRYHDSYRVLRKRVWVCH